MFDLTSSKLFLLAIVALLVIGPKDFPVLLRTIGKYVGILRGHAREFRAQFDELMRESEMADLKKEMEKLGRETENLTREAQASLNATERSVKQTFDEVRQDVESSVKSPTPVPTAGQRAAPPDDSAAAPAQAEAGKWAETAPPPQQPAPTAPGAATPAPPAGEPASGPAVERTGA